MSKIFFDGMNNFNLTAGSDVHSTPPVALPLQATPSSGQIERPFGSPGISPIRLGGGSYMETPDGKGGWLATDCLTIYFICNCNPPPAPQKKQQTNKKAATL